MDKEIYDKGIAASHALGSIQDAIWEYCWKFHEYNPDRHPRGTTVCPNCRAAYKEPFEEEYKLLSKEYPSPSRYKIGTLDWMTDEEWEAFQAKTIADAPTPTREVGSANIYKG